MSDTVIRALVLHHADYSDTDRMVTLLTASEGLVDAVARGCRRSKSPLMNAAEPFTYAEYTLFRNRDRCDMRQCTILDSHYELRRDYDRLTIGAWWLRLLKAACPHGSDCTDILELSLRALAYLSYSDVPVGILNFAFECKLLALSGLSPRMDRCCVCGKDPGEDARFSVRHGGCVCVDCSPASQSISPMARRILYKMPRSSFDNLHLLTDKPEWREAARFCRAFIGQQIPVPGFCPPEIYDNEVE